MNSNLFTTVLRRGSMVLAALAIVVVVTPAHATELVTNGGFNTGGTTSSQLGYNGFQVAGWTSGAAPNGSLGYNFLYTPGKADHGGAPGTNGSVQLWGPQNGSANGLTGSPDGGNFMGMDGVFNQSPISQVIGGLVVGQKYTLSFYYAGAQQQGFTGATTEGFQVSFGNDTVDTPMLSDASHGFTGWTKETYTFTADSTSETLSFLALGTPTGEPPFSLLDGVSMVAATPEPSSFAFMLTGLAGVSGMVRKRFKKNVS